MTIEEIKEKCVGDFDVVEILEAFTEIGYCLNLINDDNGMWAIGSDGMQSVRYEANMDLETWFFIPARCFKPTIREAITYYVDGLGEYDEI